MATKTSQLQAELDEALDDIAKVKELLDEAYAPESSREDLAGSIGEALEILEDYEDEEGDEDDEAETD